MECKRCGSKMVILHRLGGFTRIYACPKCDIELIRKIRRDRKMGSEIDE